MTNRGGGARCPFMIWHRAVYLSGMVGKERPHETHAGGVKGPFTYDPLLDV